MLIGRRNSLKRFRQPLLEQERQTISWRKFSDSKLLVSPATHLTTLITWRSLIGETPYRCKTCTGSADTGFYHKCQMDAQATKQNLACKCEHFICSVNKWSLAQWPYTSHGKYNVNKKSGYETQRLNCHEMKLNIPSPEGNTQWAQTSKYARSLLQEYCDGWDWTVS